MRAAQLPVPGGSRRGRVRSLKSRRRAALGLASPAHSSMSTADGEIAVRYEAVYRKAEAAGGERRLLLAVLEDGIRTFLKHARDTSDDQVWMTLLQDPDRPTNSGFARHSATVGNMKMPAAIAPPSQPLPRASTRFHTSMPTAIWAAYTAAHGHIHRRMPQNPQAPSA